MAYFQMKWAIAVLVIVSSASGQDVVPRTRQFLLQRQKQQTTAAEKAKAFRNFKFTDRYDASGIQFNHGVVDDAAKHWKAAHYDHGNGIVAADVDNDGLIDLYFVNQLGTNGLWRNKGGGKFEDITAASGTGLPMQICVSAAFADVDNDGDADLYVTTVRHGNHLFQNDGKGKFKAITREAGLDYNGHSGAPVFLDVDNDGWVDLFLCNVGIFTSDERGHGGYYRALTNAFLTHLDASKTEYCKLYKNQGKARFKDVSKEYGIEDGGKNGDATFCDINADGFPDLYVANMQGDDHFYLNDAGKRFVLKTAEYFPKTPWGSMGLKFLDHNNDGAFGLYVTDMHSDMNDAQRKLSIRFPLDVEKQKSEAWCMAQFTDAVLQGASNNIFGNAFYVNSASGKFSERSDTLGLENLWPWGISAGDVNADGFMDLFVTAGMNYPFRYGVNSLFINDLGERFFDAEFLVGIEPRANGRFEKDYFSLDCSGIDKNDPRCAGLTGIIPVKGAIGTRSSVLVDLDDDGDLDLVTNEFNDRPQLLISDLSAKRKVAFLKIKLQGTRSNRDGLGVVVKVHAGDKVLSQYNEGKSGYLSQSSLPLYFGLGDASTVDKIEVAWPSGSRQSITKDIALNSTIRVVEPNP